MLASDSSGEALSNALKKREVHMPLVSQRPKGQQQAHGHRMRTSCHADSSARNPAPPAHALAIKSQEDVPAQVAALNIT
jgi:hypothetical protein